MADKFPEIETDSQLPQDELTEDFLTREKQLLGVDAEQFQTEEDAGVFEQEDDEIKKFEDQFPDVGDSAQDQLDQQTYNEQLQNDTEEEFDEPAFNPPKTESDAVREWKERYKLEITKRDEEDSKKTAETKAAAEKQLDDFYDSYNTKKDENIAKAKEAEADFLSKREEFFVKGDVWSRALDLVKDSKPNQRFKELLEAKSRSTQQ